jgi:hypothetical protein
MNFAPQIDNNSAASKPFTNSSSEEHLFQNHADNLVSLNMDHNLEDVSVEEMPRS